MTVLLISFIVKSCQSISINCPLLMLALWACGQRACVVHHVHSGMSTVLPVCGRRHGLVKSTVNLNQCTKLLMPETATERVA